MPGKKFFAAVFSCIIVVVTVAIWNFSLASSPSFFLVNGTVLDEASGLPLAGAAVEVAGHTVLTGTEGSYTIRRVSPGEHTLQVLMQNYEDHKQTIRLNGILTVDVHLSPSTIPPPPANAVLTGKIVDAETGLPITGASVWIAGNRAITAMDGIYTLNVEIGTYILVVGKAEYITEMASVDVSDTKTYSVDLAITPKSLVANTQISAMPRVLHPDRGKGGMETLIRAVVEMSDGSPAAGVTVNFESRDKELPNNPLGTFSSPTVVTDDEGEATVKWALSEELYDQAEINTGDTRRHCLIIALFVVEGKSITTVLDLDIYLSS